MRRAGYGQPFFYQRLWRRDLDGYHHDTEGSVYMRPLAARPDLCEATFDWGHGSAIFHRGTHFEYLAKLQEILWFGPGFSPAYNRLEHVPVSECESDESVRATVPEGQFRLKRFFNQRLLLFIRAGVEGNLGIVTCSVFPEEGDFELEAQGEGERWCDTRPLAVCFGGRLLKVRVSNFPNELGFCFVDGHVKGRRLVLVPLKPPEGAPLTQLEVVLVDDHEPTQLGVVSIKQDLFPGTPEQVIWSDGAGTPWTRSGQTFGHGGSTSADSSGVAATPGAHRTPTPASASASRASRTPQPPGPRESATPPHPAFVPLLVRYFGELAESGKTAVALRRELGLPGGAEEISPLMRAVEHGVDLRGRGHVLWSALEMACGFKSRFRERTHYNFLTRLQTDGIICRPCADTSGRILPLSEFGHPCAEAARRLCARFGTTPERVLDEWEVRSSRTTPPSPPPRPPTSRTSEGGSDARERPPAAAATAEGPEPPPSEPPESGQEPPEPAWAAEPENSAGPTPAADEAGDAESWFTPWEHLRIRPKYESDDDDIVDDPDLNVDEDDDDDDDDGNGGSPRGPP